MDYPQLYHNHFGTLPSDWRVGHVNKLWTGYASDPGVRRTGASGGVTSAVLIYLLATKRIDSAILAKQATPTPAQASWCIARTREEVLACAQSVSVPLSMLDSIRHLVPGERYAMTCVPEQSAALRVLQHGGDERARQIEFVLGPYTGTALDRRPPPTAHLQPAHLPAHTLRQIPEDWTLYRRPSHDQPVFCQMKKAPCAAP